MLERWNPFTEVDRMLSDMDRLLSQTVGRSRLLPRLTGFSPLVDLYDTGDRLVLKALVPGARPEDIDISLEQNTLTISGRYGQTLSEDEAKNVTWYRREIGAGQFAETFTLPVPVNADQAEASFENGILTLTMPKAEQARTRRIPIRAPQALEAGK